MQVSMFVELARVPRRADDREHRVTVPRAPHTLAHSHCLCTVETAMLCSHPSNHKARGRDQRTGVMGEPR